MATLTVIVGTLGRPTLATTLRSISEQGADEVIVVADPAGNPDHAKLIGGLFGATYYQCESNEHGRGNAQKTYGVTKVTSTHFAFMDDDDTYLPGALDAMRERATTVPVVFRMRHPQLGVLWTDPVLRWANVGTPMFLIPNRPGLFGEWVPYEHSNYPGGGGDYSFITGTCAKQGEPEWDQRLICQVRP